jgi:hypothetical protein
LQSLNYRKQKTENRKRHKAFCKSGGLPSRAGHLPQQPPRKKVMTRNTTTTIITHSIHGVLSPDGAAPSLILKAAG